MPKHLNWSALAMLWFGLAWHASAAEPSFPKAVVPDDLRADRAYIEYTAALIQLDLLANPATASLPVGVLSSPQGAIVLSGTVPSTKIHQYLLGNAQRISGLRVMDEMHISAIEGDPSGKVSRETLENLTNETLQTLFPDLAPNVRSTVTGDGIVSLHGTVSNYEDKVNLSKAVKSQPGCRAVVNLLLVQLNLETGTIAVSDDGRLKLRANHLPSIPPAPLIDLSNGTPQQLTIRELSSRRGAADDSPDQSLRDRQVREDVRYAIEQEPSLAGVSVEVEAESGIVTISGDLKSREQVETAIAAACEVSGVQKVVARCQPYSIQRTLARQSRRRTAEEEKEESGTKAAPKAPAKREKLLGFIPWSKGDDDSKKDLSSASDRRYRESVRKSLKKRCENRVDKLSVKNTPNGLVIEGEVANARDRAYVLRQVDNLAELRGIDYQIVIRIREF